MNTVTIATQSQTPAIAAPLTFPERIRAQHTAHREAHEAQLQHEWKRMVARCEMEGCYHLSAAIAALFISSN